MAAPTKEHGPSLYVRMIKSIASSHTFGNRVRMVKLPLIFVEEQLYAGAIGQFFWLTEALEAAVAQHADDPMVQRIKALGLGDMAPRYAADLEQILGPKWRTEATRIRTAATSAYCDIIATAGSVELVAAAFILYGALVVGGGKMTQKKVKKIFPNCDHKLFDVADNMKEARQHFMNTFNKIGKEWPEHFETLEQHAARFMSLNNSVVLSIPCLGNRARAVATGLVVAGVALAAAAVRRNRRP
ncbi:hypothetical protein CTAYLR_002174 [Chrysophaeum taylorii]|uniref:Uncharacterized protein n=1 Tax=Chrysophaeum taylorii TaxID=2483200 RepID=A0AAD7UN86_9STRA|nr:hypothetical protein CTAYLR_002174 [Chrysophaeum taylorii]